MANTDLRGKVPQVQARSAGNVNVTAQSTGAGVAEAFSEAGAAVEDAALKQREKNEKTDAQDRMNAANKQQRELLNGRPEDEFEDPATLSDPDYQQSRKGYLNLNESQAMAAKGDHVARSNAALDDAMEAAPNDRVRALMSQRIENLRENSANSMDRHERGERDKYDDRVQLDTMTEGKQNAAAAASAGGYAAAKQDLSDVRAQTYQYNISNGATAAQANNAADTATSKVHQAVLTQMLKDGRVSDARKYQEDAIKADGKKYDTDIRSAMNDLINGDEVISKAQATVRDISGDHDLSTGSGATAALAAVRDAHKGKGDEEVLEKAVSDMRSLITERTTLKKRLYTEGFDKLATRARMGEVIKESERTGLERRDRVYLDGATAEGKLRVADPDYDRPGDGGKTWESYQRNVADVKKFREQTFLALKGKYELGVTKDIWERTILPMWTSLNQRGDAEKDPTGITEGQRIQDFAVSAGVDLKKEKGFSDWRTEYDARVRQSGADTPDAKTKILDGMVKEKIIYDRNDFGILSSDSSKLAFNMTDANKLAMAKDADIKVAKRDLFVEKFDIILDSLRGRNSPITRDNILHTFNLNF